MTQNLDSRKKTSLQSRFVSLHAGHYLLTSNRKIRRPFWGCWSTAAKKACLVQLLWPLRVALILHRSKLDRMLHTRGN
jgi:hypothetical protein